MSMEIVSVKKDLRAQRLAEAEAWRRSLGARGILCINMISSPGAGKTSLLQSIAKRWGNRMAVLVGDIATDRDAQRLAPFVQVKQLTTGGACHLELPLVQSGWDQLDQQGVQFLFIENIGNLVCPASHDLGEHLRVVVLSVTEGDDKPGKYPKAFRMSHACIVNKIDLLPYVPFSLDAFVADARLIRSDIPILPVSAVTEQGVADWCDFLETSRQTLLVDPAQ